MSLRRTIYPPSGYVSPAALTVPCVHWTSLRREWGVQYSVLLDDDTEVDLLPQDDGCKLYYGRSSDQEHVVDLGRFNDEGTCSLPPITGWPSCWSGRSWQKKRRCYDGDQDT